MAKLWIVSFAALVKAKQLRSLASRAGRRFLGWRMPRPVDPLPRLVPKTVWLYWDKGEAAAPPLIKACIESWRARNPSWEIRVLDAGSAPGVVELPFAPGDVPVQSYADLLRLRLLAIHGGVWADVTTWCATPLDHWLPPVAQSGFFAFQWTDADAWMIWPNVRRRMTNWFLAAVPGNHVIINWEAKSLDYWSGKRRRPHIYYWPHVLIDYLYLTDRAFRRAMTEVPQLGCYGAHLVHDHVERGSDPEAIRALIDGGVAPVQKLRWNWTTDKLARAAEVIPALAPPAELSAYQSPATR